MINLLSCSPFHFLLLPQHNFSKSYHKQSAIIPILIWMCWIFFLFLAFHCYLNELNFLAPGIVSISLVYIFLPFTTKSLYNYIKMASFTFDQTNLHHHPGANISDISGQALHVSLNRFCDLKSCKSSWSISFAQSFVLQLRWLKLHLIKQTRVIILKVIFSISNVQRYMFRLMAQEFEHILCNYIEISFYLLLLLAKMKILLNKGRRIFISNSLTWWSST